MSATFLSSFSNILAYGLIQVASNPEVGGWKWIYVIEGAITVGLALLSRLIIVDFPDSKRNTFLSAAEVEIVNRRLLEERGQPETEKVTWKVLREAMLHWPTWARYVTMPTMTGCRGFPFPFSVLLWKSSCLFTFPDW